MLLLQILQLSKISHRKYHGYIYKRQSKVSLTNTLVTKFIPQARYAFTNPNRIDLSRKRTDVYKLSLIEHSQPSFKLTEARWRELTLQLVLWGLLWQSICLRKPIIYKFRCILPNRAHLRNQKKTNQEIFENHATKSRNPYTTAIKISRTLAQFYKWSFRDLCSSRDQTSIDIFSKFGLVTNASFIKTKFTLHSATRFQ